MQFSSSIQSLSLIIPSFSLFYLVVFSNLWFSGVSMAKMIIIYSDLSFAFKKYKCLYYVKPHLANKMNNHKNKPKKQNHHVYFNRLITNKIGSHRHSN